MNPLKFDLSNRAIRIDVFRGHLFEYLYYDEKHFWRGLQWEGVVRAYEEVPYKGSSYPWVSVYDAHGFLRYMTKEEIEVHYGLR
jgi:hypothetical protein